MVACIGRPHGLRGEVTVQSHTDQPAERFTPGAEFVTEPAMGGLTIRSARLQGKAWVLGFVQVTDREGAEAIRGTRLLAEPDSLGADDGFYEDDLVGLEVVLVDGSPVGTVTALHQRPAQDLIEVELSTGGAAYLPFVDEIVPEVDLESGRMVIDPPPGLLELAGA